METRKNRIAQRLDYVDMLLDECDECGSMEDIKFYRRKKNLSPTTLRREADKGWSEERLKEEAKAATILCKGCRKEVKV